MNRQHVSFTTPAICRFGKPIIVRDEARKEWSGYLVDGVVYTKVAPLQSGAEWVPAVGSVAVIQ